MLPTLAQVLELPALHQGRPTVRTGGEHLERPVRWVHVSEVPWIAGLLEGGELILTTGIGLPRAQRDLRRYVEELDAVGVCGVVVELGRRYRALPAGLVDAAAEVGLPLVELHREARFVAVTQQVHTLILEARMSELAAAHARQAHRALLTVLAVSPEVPADLTRRAADLDVPTAGRSLTAFAVRVVGPAPDPSLLRELASRAATVLQDARIPALVAPLDDQRVVVLLSQPRSGPDTALTRRLAERLHTVADRHRGGTLAVGVGATVTGIQHAPTTVREALQVADTAADLPAHRGWFRASDERLAGLLYALRESAQLRGFVVAELGPLLAHDRERGTALTDFLDAYCRAGGNKTAAAAALFISRPALYERIGRVEAVLGVDLGDPRTVLSLHVALLARAAAERPGTSVRAC